jgi:hypothetical protein
MLQENITEFGYRSLTKVKFVKNLSHFSLGTRENHIEKFGFITPPKINRGKSHDYGGKK